MSQNNNFDPSNEVVSNHEIDLSNNSLLNSTNDNDNDNLNDINDINIPIFQDDGHVHTDTEHQLGAVETARENQDNDKETLLYMPEIDLENNDDDIKDHMSPVPIQNNELEAKLIADIHKFRSRFGRWTITSSGKREELRRYREDLIEFARKYRNDNPDLWTPSAAVTLRSALLTADARLSGKYVMKTSTSPHYFEKYDKESDFAKPNRLRSLLTNTHVNLYECAFIVAGHTCIIVMFYVPWIVSSFIFLNQVESDPTMLATCKRWGQFQFLLGFVIILLVNLGCSTLISVSKSINKGNNWYVFHDIYKL